MSQITSSTRKKFFLNVDAEIPSRRTGYPSSSEGFQCHESVQEIACIAGKLPWLISPGFCSNLFTDDVKYDKGISP